MKTNCALQENLVKFRLERDLTPSDVARVLQIPVRKYIGYEQKISLPTYEELKTLVQYYNETKVAI